MSVDRETMRVLVLGGTTFIGRRVVERLHERGDDVLVVHRGRQEPQHWVPVAHLHADRHHLSRHVDGIRAFDPGAIIDTYAMTERDVTAVLPTLPEVPTVVLSSQDVYEAFAGLREGRFVADGPLTEEAQLRLDRYPYRGLNIPGIPHDYEKIDVENAWAARKPIILRLPMTYGPHDSQRREELVLRRIRAGRRHMPIGAGELLWTRAHVDDIATGVLRALDTPDAAGEIVNLGETTTAPIREWFRQIAHAAAADLEFVTVPDEAVPAELALTRAPAQHVQISSARAQELFGWAPGEPHVRVAESVQWHLRPLRHPPEATWGADDARTDDVAIAAARR